MPGVLRVKVGGVWQDIPVASSSLTIEDIWPAGSIRTTIKATADIGWLLFGQTVADAQTLYPTLWGIAPTGWKSGSSLVIPSDVDCGLRGSSAAGLGQISGTNTKTIATINLPAHAHTINHDHGGSTTGYVSADHVHSGQTGGFSSNHLHNSDHVGSPSDFMYWRYGYGTTNFYNASAVAGGDWQVNHTTNWADRDHSHAFSTGGISANHYHSTSVPAFNGNSGNTGSGTALNVQDAAINVRFQIKAH